MLHPSTHSREIWTTFGKTWAIKASFSAHHHSRFKITSANSLTFIDTGSQHCCLFSFG